MMNLKKLYVMEAESNTAYYSNPHNRAYDYNELLNKKAWLSGKIKMYEVNIADIHITLEGGAEVKGEEIK